MNDESWKIQYKQWKNLKPYQIKLIENGPKSQSQAWLLNSMWCEWMDLKRTTVSDFQQMTFLLGQNLEKTYGILIIYIFGEK